MLSVLHFWKMCDQIRWLSHSLSSTCMKIKCMLENDKDNITSEQALSTMIAHCVNHLSGPVRCRATTGYLTMAMNFGGKTQTWMVKRPSSWSQSSLDLAQIFSSISCPMVLHCQHTYLLVQSQGSALITGFVLSWSCHYYRPVGDSYTRLYNTSIFFKMKPHFHILLFINFCL